MDSKRLGKDDNDEDLPQTKSIRQVPAERLLQSLNEEEDLSTIMASDLSFHQCACHNPFWMHLAKKLFTKDVLSKLSKLEDKVAESICPDPISVMYTGGIIRPMIGGSTATVEAVGFHGGQVVAVGSLSTVVSGMQSLGAEYETIQLSDGHTLIPGLIEPHLHIVMSAIQMSWKDFSPFEGQDMRKPYDMHWLKKQVQGCKKSLIEGEHFEHWILGVGVDPSLMPPISDSQLQGLDCDTIDEKIERDIPVMMISASMHTAYVNTAAVEMIWKKNEVHKNFRDIYGGKCEFLAHVKKNGGLQEIAEMKYGIEAIPIVQLAAIPFTLMENLHEYFTTANKRGVTLMYDAGMTSLLMYILELYHLIHPCKSKVRIGYANLCENYDDAKSVNECEKMGSSGRKSYFYNGSIKIISDGSNQGLTGYQCEPYCCYAPNKEGVFNFPPFSRPTQKPEDPNENFSNIVKTIIQKGVPLMIHANGDKAIDIVIGAYEDALSEESGEKMRHRIEHCSLLDDSTIDRMKSLGISPSFLIGHVGYWGHVFKTMIFHDKAEKLDRCKSALEKGMRITLHSDNAVTPLGPLRMMEQAVTRRMESDPNPNDCVLNDREKISIEQALRAVTYDAAWQCHADHVGCLETGNFADYIILEEDPITRQNPVGIRNIKVLETWVGGHNVYPEN